MKRIFLWLLTICMLCSVFSARTENAEAASYPNINASKTVQFIANRNVNVYTDANLRTRGTSSPYRKYNAYAATNDLCYILSVTSPDSLRISYPTGSGYKQGYVRRSDVLYAGSPSQFYTSKAKVTTYRRPGGSSYGYVAVGDSAYVFGSTSGYRGIIYNISGGKYKFGWIRENELSAIIGSTSNTSGWQMPMTNAYVCGNNWLTYYKARPDRPYHLGLDLASRNGDANVYAAAGGTVAAVGYNSANGNYVILKHTLSGKTVYSFYCHLKSYCVANNNSVRKGQKIGVFGNTGSSSAGAHLHFAIADRLNSSGGYYGYGNVSSGNKVTYSGTTFYNPHYVVSNGKLP